MGVASLGTIIINNEGMFHAAVAVNIGYNNNITAKLWVVKEGLQLLKHLYITNIHIQTNCLAIFHMIHRKHTFYSHRQTILL